jgi:hypothetical protein
VSISCLTCLVSTGVGEMSGGVGLPTLDERSRDGGPHPLAAELTGIDGDTGEDAFGFIDLGFRAIGLHLHAHDVFRAFLTEHAGHRIYLTGVEPDWDVLLPNVECRDADGFIDDPTAFIDYKEPRKKEGYIQASLVFECSRCADTFVGNGCNNWVKPFAPKMLAADEIAMFREHVAHDNAEVCFHEAEPFDILYSSLGAWLGKHQDHGVIMRLVQDR